MGSMAPGGGGGVAAAATLTPLHHIAYLQRHEFLINLRAARPNLSKEECNSFLRRDSASVLPM
jgi:hypothetical protein